jgi:hypothetical protein
MYTVFSLLDVATRLSSACCEKFVSVNAVHVIYRLMKGCNRSQPHMELLKYSVTILLNLAKVGQRLERRSTQILRYIRRNAMHTSRNVIQKLHNSILVYYF